MSSLSSLPLRGSAAGRAPGRERARPAHTESELEDENLLVVAAALVDAALHRRTSVGAHFRADDTADSDASARTTPSIPAENGATRPSRPAEAPDRRSSADVAAASHTPAVQGATTC